MKRLVKLTIALVVAVGSAGSVLADSLEGVWKIKSGRWSAEDSEVVYPSDPESDEGAMAFRTFTKNHHFFISRFPAENIFNATMSKYTVDGNTLRMEKVLTRNPKHYQEWEWTFDLAGDELTLEMEGMREVWIRIE
jgi:hypothetical protein